MIVVPVTVLKITLSYACCSPKQQTLLTPALSRFHHSLPATLARLLLERDSVGHNDKQIRSG